MRRFHVIGSLYEYMYSYDCLADNPSEAVSKFSQAFERTDLRPTPLDVDSPAIPEWFRGEWFDGRKWESGGYCY